ncbi:MAG: NAD(P)H-hydrate dehydratase, partial [Lysobacteraceae bacterium]
AARLLDVSVDAIQRDRFAAAQAIAERYAATVVLKGAGSLVAAPGEVPAIIDAGNPGMAGGGVGDVLTGVIAALRAQGLAAFDAARCGALLHAAAGDAAACDGGERGLLASDLFPHLRRLANPCN